MASSEQLRELLHRYLNSTASREELEELFRLANDQEHEEELRESLSDVWNRLENDRTDDADQTPQPAKVPSKSRIGQRLLYAAAVTGIIVLGCGIWLFPKTTKTSLSGTTLPSNKSVDFAPGKKGAILTLSDGRKLALDSGNAGIIASQGNSNIVKVGGTLQYQNAGDRHATGGPEIFNTVTTPRGRHYELVLPDGTKVWLNAASGITYPVAFSGKERRVQINGEAYLEVAKDKYKPFHISLNDFEIEVLGTHFNVNAYPDESGSKTTLLEGAILISCAAGKEKLKPGEQASISSPVNATQTISIIDHADLQQAVAWKNGYFNFNNTDVKTVLRELERWYDVNVSFEGNVPPHPIYGKMQRELYLSQVLNIVKKLGVNYRMEGKNLIVMP